MKATEDFFLLILYAHSVAAAKIVLEEAQASETSDVADVASAIVSRFVNLDLSNPLRHDDGVVSYACELLTLGLIWHGFHDATKEGDGDRIIRYWKLLLILFKAAGRRNYSLEALYLLQQCQQLSDRHREQLIWGRTVNTIGRQGCNIACDLHMEHLNRRVKNGIRHLGANITGPAILRTGQSIGVINSICQLFESELNVTSEADKHSYPSFGRDFSLILSTLEEFEVFTKKPERQYTTVKWKIGLLQTLKKDNLLQWAKEKLMQRVTHTSLEDEL